jgi:hypothetical protein
MRIHRGQASADVELWAPIVNIPICVNSWCRFECLPGTEAAGKASMSEQENMAFLENEMTDRLLPNPAQRGSGHSRHQPNPSEPTHHDQPIFFTVHTKALKRV